MNSIIRVTGAVTKVNPANPHDCLDEILALLRELPAGQSDIVVLPKLALCSPSAGNLFYNPALLEGCEEALERLREETADMPSYILAGLAFDDYGAPACATALLYRGELIGLIPTLDNAAPFKNSGFSENLLHADTVFACGAMRFCVLSCSLSMLTMRGVVAAQSGADLIIVPAYSPVRAGTIDEVCQSAAALSKATGCAVAVVNGGVGDTSSPYLYNGFVAFYENGERLAREIGGFESFSATVDFDLDVIRSSKKITAYTEPAHGIAPYASHPGLLRPVSPCPWLPGKKHGRYLSELFLFQVRSLAARMQNTGINKLVIGVSGGLDSTSALLVSAGAVDVLGLPRENIVGITMPGFGTSDRTHYNALALLEALSVSRREIPIRESVRLHLEEIGHTGGHDTTYENAQARERAQILLDVANDVGGLVVGTGDLSEEALGFCTFAGDHIANYNVNVCIPKSVLRLLVRHIADENLVQGIQGAVADILDTPISPELLPPAESGEIQQKTEEILGPYELYDFFVYYFVRYRMRPSKIYYYATVAFSDHMEPAFIRDKLAEFFKRFCAAQFKRACAPDAASITEVNLLGTNYYIPSDLDPTALLREVESLG